MFSAQGFVEDCQLALATDKSHLAVREVVARAVSDPRQVMADLGPPTKAGLKTIYRSAEMTILNVVWAPLMTLSPHNHAMWAVIGVYTGREDNIFWRRTDSGIEAAGADALSAKDAVPLGKDIIHSVTNPITKHTGAIHVYGGDFFAVGRSEWESETLAERSYDADRNMRLFKEADERFAAYAGT